MRDEVYDCRDIIVYLDRLLGIDGENTVNESSDEHERFATMGLASDDLKGCG